MRAGFPGHGPAPGAVGIQGLSDPAAVPVELLVTFPDGIEHLHQVLQQHFLTVQADDPEGAAALGDDPGEIRLRGDQPVIVEDVTDLDVGTLKNSSLSLD